MGLCHPPKVLIGGLITRWIKNELSSDSGQFVFCLRQLHLFPETGLKVCGE
jgi:hypothetical protein